MTIISEAPQSRNQSRGDAPTFPQQLVRLSHAVLDDTLAVVQRFDAGGLDGVHLSEQSRQSLREQLSRARLKFGEVSAERLAGLTGAAADLSTRSKCFKDLAGRRQEELTRTAAIA